ncbi:DUF6730 family protein [Maribacter sp. 2307UL18-2]|uniref:DUF6730 family protein n=1 Tax=Maribacter sp. 2307UL18-2 TaxID=3386274 RepID=UPI0039BCA6C9
MAKLDEIAELLTEEIKGFENSINRMEQLKKFLMTYKVQADTSDIDFILKRYNDHQKKAVDEQNKLLANVIYHIKKSMAFPKWSIKLFWGLLVCIFLVLSFSVYKVLQIPKLEQNAYGQGEEKAIAHFKAFFEASPEASELYQEWRKPQNKE